MRAPTRLAQVRVVVPVLALCLALALPFPAAHAASWLAQGPAHEHDEPADSLTPRGCDADGIMTLTHTDRLFVAGSGLNEAWTFQMKDVPCLGANDVFSSVQCTQDANGDHCSSVNANGDGQTLDVLDGHVLYEIFLSGARVATIEGDVARLT